LALYCVDASFTVGWLVRSSLAVVERWRSFFGDDELMAPSLLRAECASVFARQVHAGRIDEGDGRLQVQRMLRIPVRIIDRAPLYSRAFDIARSLGKSKAYDALYLAAAEEEAAELLTIDGGMCDDAKRLGIRATLVR